MLGAHQWVLADAAPPSLCSGGPAQQALSTAKGVGNTALMMVLVHACVLPAFLLVLLVSHVCMSRAKSRAYSAPFYRFKRWTWTELPSGAREHLRIAIVFSLLFGLLAIWAFSRRPPYPGLGIEGLVLFMSLSFALLAGRLIHRKVAIGRGQ